MRGLLPLLAALSLLTSAKASSRHDFETVRSAEFFCSFGIGYGGIAPEWLVSYWNILKAEDGEKTFIALLKDPKCSRTGKLYALMGLSELNSEEFEDWADEVRDDDTMMEFYIGCCIGRDPFWKMVQQIENGYWPIGRRTKKSSS